MKTLTPSPFLTGVTPYRTPLASTPVDLYLNGNEGIAPPSEVLNAALKAGADAVRRYPDNEAMESLLASRLGIPTERLVVTAGADDALARIMRASLAPGREMILPVPTFEMLDRYAKLAGGDVVEVPWSFGPLPVGVMLNAVTERTSLIVVVTPNSPMGQAATERDLQRLSDAAPGAMLLVDLAYVDFADNDLTSFALTLPNVVITRTLSKAWGLAGLRVGYAASTPEIIGWLRAAGQPYSVSSLSLAVALERLKTAGKEVDDYINAVKTERGILVEKLAALGVETAQSQGNFVFARFDDAVWVRDLMAGLGIAVRAFPSKKGIENGMRITVPGNDTDFSRLVRGFETVLAPKAMIFDIDDTLTDVTQSYRRATVAAAAEFGASVTFDDITEAKAAGNANNDWELTLKLILERGKSATIEQVTECFEDFYQGTAGRPGFKTKETLLCDKSMLEGMAKRKPLGIVTGRPRKDAAEFLERNKIEHLFKAVVTMDDGPLKPSPVPMKLALERLGVDTAWMVGDTPDDMRSARGAGVVPLGVIAPADDPKTARAALISAGAGRVLSSLNELKERLP
jgi:histidinol-phosphate aminotransferase